MAATSRAAETERAAAAEKEAATRSGAEAKAQLDAANATIAKQSEEQKALKEAADKSNKTITQLKQLGRKFKEQSQQLTNEKSELQKALDAAVAQAGVGAGEDGDGEKEREISELREKLQGRIV